MKQYAAWKPCNWHCDSPTQSAWNFGCGTSTKGSRDVPARSVITRGGSLQLMVLLGTRTTRFPEISKSDVKQVVGLSASWHFFKLSSSISGKEHTFLNKALGSKQQSNMNLETLLNALLPAKKRHLPFLTVKARQEATGLDTNVFELACAVPKTIDKISGSLDFKTYWWSKAAADDGWLNIENRNVVNSS